jgi:exodeoxyribonuclease-3
VRLFSWNVNGIRACGRKGFLDWFQSQAPDIVCVQETKARPEQLEEDLLHPPGFHSYWHSAQKKGYSGVATYTTRRPLSVTEGIGVDKIDDEGRVLITEFRGFALFNAYFPNSQHGHARLPYKLRFCRAIHELMDEYRAQGKNTVICGDFNIAHSEIDLANPKANVDNPGFLPEERAWMDEFVAADYVDTFRRRNKEGGHYTWWSYRQGVRERNIGWRLDYFFANPEFCRRIKNAFIQPGVMGSDHCPIGLELR